MFLDQGQKITKVHLLKNFTTNVFGSLQLDLRYTHTHEPEVLTRPNFHTSLIRELNVVEPKQFLDLTTLPQNQVKTAHDCFTGDVKLIQLCGLQLE